MTRTLLALWFISSAALAADTFDGLADPTRPSFGRASAADEGRGVGGLVLQSVLVSPERRIAVINGTRVTVGGRVGNALVTEIEPYAVTLQRESGLLRLTLLPPRAAPMKRPVGP